MTRDPTELAEALVVVLDRVDGLRAYPYEPDKLSPPAVVVEQPTLDLEAADQSPCWGAWDFPLRLVVPRPQDRQAQKALAAYLAAIVDELRADPQLGGACSLVRIRRASPDTVTASGVDLPAYTIETTVYA